jgi:hypothetical protein
VEGGPGGETVRTGHAACPQPNDRDGDHRQRAGLGMLFDLSTELSPARQHHGRIRPSSASAPADAARLGIAGPGDRLMARVCRGPWPMAAVLLIQACLSLRLVWSNTAFADESLYLWSGHLEIAHLVYGTKIPEFQTYFSGAPVIYPVLGAIADAYGGLALARIVSLFFMLGATCLLYSLTSRLFDRAAALCAAGIFAVLGPVQVLGAFATYDAMAIFLLALGTRLAVHTASKISEALLVIAGLVLALADATKYATALWTPVVIALAMLTATQGSWPRRALRGIRLSAYTATPLAIALYRFGGKTYIHGVMFTTLARQAESTEATATVVLADTLTWIGIVIALAIIATAASFTARENTKWICLVLTIAPLLAPLHQAQIHTTTSLHKHVIFGAWFGAAPAGYILAKLREVNPVKAWRAGAATFALALFFGYPQATQMFVYGWPNTSQMNADLARVIPQSGCPCLIAEESQLRYYVPRLSEYDVVGPYTFNYWSDAERKELDGISAYREAILDHYFSVVEIDPAEDLANYQAIDNALMKTPGYQLEDSIKIDHWGRRTMQIWRNVSVSG